MFEPISLATLLIGALVLSAGGYAALRMRLPKSAGYGLALAALALVFALLPTDLRQWVRGGDPGEQVLSTARAAGIAGLLFIAGARFDGLKVWSLRRISLYTAAAGLILFTIVAVLLSTVWGQPFGLAVTAGAAVAGTSPWLTGELTRASKDETLYACVGASAALAAIVVLTLHLITTLGGLAGRASATTYAVVISYELVKAAVIFGFGYLVTTRFLARAEDRVSRARVTGAYVIICILLFVLAATAIGQLAAFAWAFVAGAVWSRGREGERFAAKERPAATALLLSLALLPPLLQTHGRIASNWAALTLLVASVLVTKFVLLGAGARTGGAAWVGATRVAAASLATLELAPAFLGLAVTRWEVGGDLYLGILAFTGLSMIVGPLVLRLLAREGDAGETGMAVKARRSAKRRGARPSKAHSRKGGFKRIKGDERVLALAEPAGQRQA